MDESARFPGTTAAAEAAAAALAARGQL